MTTTTDALVGKVLQQRYRVIERLAEGAMGVVYRGERLTLQRPVAIKFLHPAVAQQPNLRKRFEVEARAMGRLSHPNCVSVIDFGVEEVPYVVMDFVEGKSLRDVLSEAGLSRDRALGVARQLLTALVHAHAQGIIHRDIKPENMILQQSAGLEDHVRVLDFGMARIANATEGLTVGMVLGTPNYMAPEQAQEGEIDARADLYSTAIVMFEMLAKRQPFAADSVGEVLRRQLVMPAPRLRQVIPNAGISQALESVVLKALEKAPKDRFASAQAMLDALEQVPELQGKASVAAVMAVAPTQMVRGLPPPPFGAKSPPAPQAADPTQWDPSLADRVSREVQKPQPEPAAYPTMVLADLEDAPKPWQRAFLFVSAAASRAVTFAKAVPTRRRYGVAAAGAMLIVLVVVWLNKGASPPPEPSAAIVPAKIDTRKRSAEKPLPKQPVAKTVEPESEAAPQAASESPERPNTSERKARSERRSAPLKKASSAQRWGTRWEK